MATNSAATLATVPRFRKVNGRVQLRHGDVAFLAEETGRSASHISRVLAGDRTSPDLMQRIEALVGVPIKRIDSPRHRRPKSTSR